MLQELEKLIQAAKNRKANNERKVEECLIRADELNTMLCALSNLLDRAKEETNVKTEKG